MNAERIKGRQKAFAEKVAEGHTATEAYLLAGYHAAKRETAHRAASRLYAKAEIRAYIQELRQAGDQLAREEVTFTIAQKLAFLARLVLTGSPSLGENDPLIQSHRVLKDGSRSIRMPCKLKALKMHSELAGHFPPKPVDQPTPIDPLQELVDQIRKMAGGPSPQPASWPPDADTLTETDPRPTAGGTNQEFRYHQSRDCGSRASLAEAADLSKNAQPPTTPTPRATGGTHNQSQDHKSRDGGTNQTHEPQQTSTNDRAAVPKERSPEAPQFVPTYSGSTGNTGSPHDIPTGMSWPLRAEPHWPLAPTSVTTPTQLRRLLAAQLQQSSPIRYLYLGNHDSDLPSSARPAR